MIPALIVPVLNRPDLLHKMLASIDHPVRRIIVIDNGDVMDGFDRANVRLVTPGANLGVAASWNLGIKCAPLADWWLIVNHDIEFGPGDLAALDAEVVCRGAILYHLLGMAAFAVTAPAVEAVGFWDENIHPAYDEDIDWERRADLAGVVKVQSQFTGTHVGSATIYSDPVLRSHNGYTHSANDRYYAEKWGGPKIGGETFTTPFNRGGHVGDWRLDIERLRRQAWPDRDR